MRTWLEPPTVAVSPDLAAAVGGHRLVAETLVRRGLADSTAALAFLDPNRYRPAPAADLPDMDRAVRRLLHGIRRREPICVWGDFDVDGQTATALLVTALRELGGHVLYHVPVRETESHGVNLPVLGKLLDEGVRLLLTCDTGITAHEAVALAGRRGVDVIITDHHDLSPTLPPAYAVVNPKRLSPAHPLAGLPGVGVAYKLVEALGQAARQPLLAERHLDLVALGIVADLAWLTGDTRYLLQRGLTALRQTGRLGLRILIETAGLNPAGLAEDHIAYALAPRLNAVGRLADANVVIDLLTTTDSGRAHILAADMEALNNRRKLLCDQVYAAAEAQLARDRALAAEPALVLAGPTWPAGVIGIVAARLVERYGKPTLLFAAPPAGIARGSARSVPGLNITAAIAEHADLLLSFGGHPMAAGLSLPTERLPEFRRAFCRTVGRRLPDGGGQPTVEIAGYVSLSDLTADFVTDLERLAPFGPGNPSLVLGSRNLELIASREVGRQREHLLVTVADPSGQSQEVIWWDGAGENLPEGRFDLAYTVRSSNYGGQRGLQAVWVDARPIEAIPVSIKPAPAVAVTDLRQVTDPRAALAALTAEEPGLVIWREASDLHGSDRNAVLPAQALAIWTAPAGPAELAAVLGRVTPQRIYLFGLDPGLDRPDLFLPRLAGLVKHALRTGSGRVELVALAAATAQRETTVRLGLSWLVARGHLSLMAEAEGTLYLAPGNGVVRSDADSVATRLAAALAETAAYRHFFRTADALSLIQPHLPTRHER